MEEKKNEWQDKRYIALLRQSNDKDGKTSTEAQLDLVVKEAEKVGMKFVAHISLEGVTGSLPGRREDLDALLERKRTKNDFDVIAIQVEDRLTRGGGEHGMWFEHECKRHRIRIFFADDNTPKGPYSAVVRVAKYEAAHETSVNTGKRSAQGQTWAKKNGFFRTSGHTPMGCHRLYFSESGVPRCIIRNLHDGRQEQLHPETREVIGRFGTVGKKSKNRFKKQKNEYSLLVPGDKDDAQTIRVIFYLRYKKGWRGERIADFLNRNGRLSPMRRKWSQRQVESIYDNEAYTGFIYHNQTYSGRFVRGDSESGFVELDRDECDLVVAKCFTPTYRPFKEWVEVDQPHMHDFLPSDVRDLAIVGQLEMWRHRLDPLRPKKAVNAHPASFYLLTNKLIAQQDGEPLSGVPTGPKGRRVIYYRHKRSKRGHLKGSVFNRLIPAQPLHDELLRHLGEILLDTPNLRSALTQIVNDQRAQRVDDDRSDAELTAERDELDERIAIITTTLKGAALKAAVPELQRLNDRRNAIEDTLQLHRSRQAKQLRPVESVVEGAVACLGELAEHLDKLAPEPLRQLVDQMVRKADVDMATKHVRFELALPNWTLQKPKKGEKALCPPASLRSQAGYWTQRLFSVLECEHHSIPGSQKPPCYQCRRVAA